MIFLYFLLFFANDFSFHSFSLIPLFLCFQSRLMEQGRSSRSVRERKGKRKYRPTSQSDLVLLIYELAQYISTFAYDQEVFFHFSTFLNCGLDYMCVHQCFEYVRISSDCFKCHSAYVHHL